MRKSHFPVPGKFPKAPSRFNCTFANAKRIYLFQPWIFFLYPAGVFFSIFFLPDNNGSYPQASGYKENDCNRLSFWVFCFYVDVFLVGMDRYSCLSSLSPDSLYNGGLLKRVIFSKISFVLSDILSSSIFLLYFITRIK